MAERNVRQFDEDARQFGGMVVTSGTRLSFRMAQKRMTDITLAMVDSAGKRVLDVGCGDGANTYDIYEAARPALMLGFDAAAENIAVAQKKYGEANPGLEFEVCDVYDMPYEPGSFDLAIVRSLIHHLDNPDKVIASLTRIARQVLIIEPNGYSPILKVIERVSPFHRAHDEKSYAPHRLRGWIRDSGGTLQSQMYGGLVPFFCPDWAARCLKVIEPVWEQLPLLKQLGCAYYVVSYRSEQRTPADSATRS